MKRPQFINQRLVVFSFVLLLLSSALTACTGEGSADPKGTIFGNADHLDSSERIQLEEKAILGDPKAASRLVDHYMYGEQDPYQVEIWWTVGMTDGDENARTSLGWLLATGEGVFPRSYAVTAGSCKRGRAILEAAKKDGDKIATSMLDKLSKNCDYNIRH